MNSFDCYPVLFDENAPHPDVVVNDLLNNGQIPLRVITDKNDPIYKELKSCLPDGYNVKFFIVIIVYLHKFEA